MAISPEIAAAGANAASNGINSFFTLLTNKWEKKYNEKIYAKQRADALADWTRQNEYNSPEAQMRRFEMAGLNKNLIYGQSNEAPAVRSTDFKPWHPTAPQFDGGSIMRSYFDTQMQKQTIDNMKTANTVAVQDQLLKAAQTASTIAQTDSSKFNLHLAEDLRTTTLEKAKEELRKLEGETTTVLNNETRQALSNAQTLQKGIEEILNLKLARAKTQDERREIQARIKEINQSTRLKNLDANLKDTGVQPGDSIWTRVAAKILQSLGIDVDSQINPKDKPQLTDDEMRSIYRPDYKKK